MGRVVPGIDRAARPAPVSSPTRTPRARRLARAVALTAACLIAGPPAAPCAIPDGDAEPARLPGLRTGTLRFPAPGVMFVALGAEYLPDITNDLAGVRGEVARLPTLEVKLGLAEHAMFQVTWPAYNRLRVHEQAEPPPLGRRLGRVSTDWGDVTVATLIRLRADRGGWPGCGIRFAAKLPTSNEVLGIGDNTTDIFASLLVATTPAPRVHVSTDVGLGILSERTRAFAQNDVLTYGVLADWRVLERLDVVGEAAGYLSTHDGGPGTGTRGELRVGLELRRAVFHWTALAVHGLDRPSSRGLGVSLAVSSRLAVLKPEGRSPE